MDKGAPLSRASFVREAPDVRRQSLIEAAAKCLAERGVAGASVRAICARAGVSAGLLTHYFSGIDELIVATYRDVGRRVGMAIEEAVEAAGPDPRDRLQAYVTASFRPPVLDPELLATWLAFWSLVKTDEGVARAHKENYADYREGVEGLLRECWPSGVSERDVRLGAVSIAAMVDGLWLELCLDRSAFTPEEASDLAVRWIGSLLERPSFAPSAAAE